MFSENDNGLGNWSGATRLLFRFVFCYLTLWWLDCTSIFIFFLGRALDVRPPFLSSYIWQNIVPWVGTHLLHLEKIVFGGSDSTGAYLQMFCELAVALAATAVWSLLDGKRREYRRLHRWQTLAVQLVLAGMMFTYGWDKVFPNQFGKLMPSTLATQFGDMSPFDVLWSFMAASVPYTIFCGAAELLGGILLLVPGLATLGAMVCFSVMLNVFALNMTYDVPVKVLSFHLLLMSFFIFAPELPRMVRLLVLRQAVSPPAPASLSDRRWINQSVPLVYMLLGVFFFCAFWRSEWKHYAKREAAEKPPFYGVWRVDSLTVSGDPNRPFFTEAARTVLHVGPGEDHWKRIAFESPQTMQIQCLNGVTEDVKLELNAAGDSMTLSDKDVDPAWGASVKIAKNGPEALHIQGIVNGVEMSAELHKIPDSKFLLVNSQFHWTSH